MQIRSNLKTRHKRSPGVVVNASQGLIRGENGGLINLDSPDCEFRCSCCTSVRTDLRLCSSCSPALKRAIILSREFIRHTEKAIFSTKSLNDHRRERRGGT